MKKYIHKFFLIISIIFFSVKIFSIILGVHDYWSLHQNYVMTSIFLLGAIIAPLAIGSFTLCFWYSYRIKYSDEKVFDKSGKKIVFFLIANTILSVTFNIQSYLLSLFFTFIIFAKFIKKDYSIEDN